MVSVTICGLKPHTASRTRRGNDDGLSRNVLAGVWVIGIMAAVYGGAYRIACAASLPCGTVPTMKNGLAQVLKVKKGLSLGPT